MVGRRLELIRFDFRVTVVSDTLEGPNGMGIASRCRSVGGMIRHKSRMIISSAIGGGELQKKQPYTLKLASSKSNRTHSQSVRDLISLIPKHRKVSCS